MKKLLQIIDSPKMYRASVTFCSLVPLVAGAGWIYTFGFTSYPPNFPFAGVPLGIVTLFFGLALFCMYRWAIALSVLLATLATLNCLALVFSASWVYFFLAALCAIHPVVAGRHLFRQWNYLRSRHAPSTSL